MKSLRSACLLTALAVFTFLPSKTQASTCCSGFAYYCYGLCNDHGGESFMDCNVGMSHSDYCYCNDDSGTPVYSDPSGICTLPQ